MQKFIRDLSIFSGFAFVVYIVLVILFGTLAPYSFKPNLPSSGGQRNGFSYRRFKEADTTQHIDALFLGSSHTYRGYDNRIFAKAGWTSFNLGSSSQTPIQTLYLVRKYIDKLRPKYVILDVYPKLLNSDGVESALDLLSSTGPDLNMVRLIFDVNDIRVYNKFIFASYESLFEDKEIIENDNKGRDIYVSGGFVESYEEIELLDRRFSVDNYSIDDKQLTAIKSIIGELNERKIDFILIQSPILPGKYAVAKNTEFVDSAMKELDAKYVNFNLEMDFPGSHFIDFSHLNQRGVEVFNRQLLDSIIPLHFGETKSTE